jgi:hypothetical protein
MDKGLQILQKLGRRNGFMPQNDSAHFVNVEIRAGFRAGQDNQGQTGPDPMHFLEEGRARNVRQIKIDQDRRPKIRALIEGEPTELATSGSSSI